MIALNNTLKTIDMILKKEKGAALTYILVVVTIVSVLLTSIIQLTTAHLKYGATRISKEQSLHIAEAGIYFYRWYLAHNVEGLTRQQAEQFWAGGAYGVDTPYEVDYEGVGKYSITVTPPTAGSTVAIAESTGWTYKDTNIKRTVRVRFRQPSWSEYAVLSDSHIRFGDGTEVFGPLHSNGGIRFDGVAHNTISSMQTTYVDPDSGSTRPGVWTNWSGEYNTNMNSDVFLGGKEFPDSEQDFVGVVSDLSYMKEASGCNSNGHCPDVQTGAHGMYFNHNQKGRHIQLQTDGTFRIRKVKKYDSTSFAITKYKDSWATYPIPENGIIFVEDNVWIDGQIDGEKITIVSAELTGSKVRSIYIGNDILYTNYDGTDIIGLLAEEDIEIIRDSEDDLRIDAALVAQKGRVGRQYYGWYCTSWWHGHCTNYEFDSKSAITLYGAIATKERYGFAWTDGSGYTDRNLHYDNNLLDTPPPYFPTGTNYAIDSWEEL